MAAPRIDYLDPALVAILDAFASASSDAESIQVRPDHAQQYGFDAVLCSDLTTYEIRLGERGARARLRAMLGKRAQTLDYIDEKAGYMFNDAAYSFGDLGRDVDPAIFRMRIAIVEKLAERIAEYAASARRGR